MQLDPIKEIEEVVKSLDKIAGKHARPFLRRYPLFFAILITFGVACVLDGFIFFLEKIQFFRQNPSILILIGILILLLNGKLYKKFNKGE